QPFVSGSQSKTVNLPTDATAEDIAAVYQESWGLGLKCIAIYRDGCKRSQPLSTSEKSRKEEKAQAGTAPTAAPVAPEPRPYRRRLPDERTAITHKFEIQGHEGYITVGMYPDGKPGEVFIKMAKEGSTISGLMDALATQTSVALQYGVPLEVMVNKFSHMRFEPAGMTRNRQIPIAKSIVDYIFRWLASRFLDGEAQDAVGVIRREDDPPRRAPGSSPLIAPASPSPTGTNGHAEGHPDPAPPPVAKLTFVTNADAPACAECGSITVRSGACYKCLNCGATTGCG
ncbi:MAG: vitamin B12-dependent ribonucleotide reductase, partial [Candidatus Dormibacteraeota bacterium]|nr:vitamin B12-dependent ribonucleotide reductase [Candidatus Dormibacteraeota bacterium]